MRSSRWDRRALLLVIVCLALNWLGDSLDGTLARVRRQERPRYGFYVDHVVDIVGAVALMCGLGASGLLHWATAMAMLIAFLVLSSESYLATYTLSCFQLSQGSLDPPRFAFCSRLVTWRRCATRTRQCSGTKCCYSTWEERLRPWSWRRWLSASRRDTLCNSTGRNPWNRSHANECVDKKARDMMVRWGKFNLVGVVGMVVQLGALALINRLAPGHYMVATAAAIEITLLHNFVWHLHYTWRDRFPTLNTKSVFRMGQPVDRGR